MGKAIKSFDFITTGLGLEFVQQPQDVHAIAGQTARLLCTPPASIPPATVTWYKGSSPVVTRSGEFTVSVIPTLSGGQDLFFSNVQQEDSGDYLCVAVNERSVPQSRTSRVARLSVTGKLLDQWSLKAQVLAPLFTCWTHASTCLCDSVCQAPLTIASRLR